MTEDDVLQNGLTRTDRLEELPQMGFEIVVVVSVVNDGFRSRFFAGNGVMFLVPLLDVCVAKPRRIGTGVIAWRSVDAGLRDMGNRGLAEFDDTPGTLKARHFCGFAAEGEAHVNGNVAVFEQDRMYVGHVTTVFPSVNAAEGRDALGNFVDADNGLHPADEVNEKVAGNSGAIFLPAAPAGEGKRVEGLFGGRTLPCIPVEGLRGEIGRGRVFPGTGWVIATECGFYQVEFADGAVIEEFFGFGAKHGTGALCADLDDAVGFLCRGDHGESIGGVVRHGLFAIDIFSCGQGIDDDLFVPVIRDCHDDCVDVFGVEKLLIATSGADWLADDFAGQFVTAVVEVGSCYAFNPWELNGG